MADTSNQCDVVGGCPELREARAEIERLRAALHAIRWELVHNGATEPAVIADDALASPVVDECRCGCRSGGCDRPDGCRCGKDCPCGATYGPTVKANALQREWHFDRYRNGRLMAQGMKVLRAASEEEAREIARSLLYLDGNLPSDELRLSENGDGGHES
jgi:hypothetical protein